MALPNPIKESSTRPPLFHMEEELDPALQTVHRKVRLSLLPCTTLMTKTFCLRDTAVVIIKKTEPSFPLHPPGVVL